MNKVISSCLTDLDWVMTTGAFVALTTFTVPTLLDYHAREKANNEQACAMAVQKVETWMKETLANSVSFEVEPQTMQSLQVSCPASTVADISSRIQYVILDKKAKLGIYLSK